MAAEHDTDLALGERMLVVDADGFGASEGIIFISILRNTLSEGCTGPLGGCGAVLDAVHAGVMAIELDQLVVSASLDDLSVAEHEDLICPADR